MPTLPSFPTLTKRLVKLSPLTHIEGDVNLDSIKSYCEMLAGLFGIALNPDGTLNADAVNTINIANRAVIEAKLGPISVFPTKQDTGSTNTLKIALVPPITAYADGQVFFVKVLNTNTGAATLNVDNIGAIAIKKRGVVDLEAGDYDGGSVIAVAYHSGAFHLVFGSSSSTGSGGSSSAGFSGFQVYESADVAIPPAAAVAATGTLTSSGVNVSNGDTVTINGKVYTFQTVLTNVDGNVTIGASAAASLTNLFHAINNSGGVPGTDYAALTTPHPDVTATNPTATTVVVTAIVAGIGGNGITTTEAAATLNWANATLTGGITDSFTNFTHGFAVAPNRHYAYLINSVADLSFNPGDIIDLDEFTDAAGLPAFTVSSNVVNVKVERHPASIEVGALGAIDTTKWLLRVRAEIVTDASSSIFPAVSFVVKQPLGAFSNGSDLFFCQYGGYNGGITYIQRLALSNNNVELLARDTGATNPQNINAAPFKKTDGSNHFIFTSHIGIYSLPMLEPSVDWRPVLLTSASIPNQKPVHIVEAAGIITEVYGVSSAYGVNGVNGLQAYRVTVGSGAIALYGTNLDLTSALIKSADGTAGNVEFRAWHQAGSLANVIHFQYNQLKKRIYVIANETSQLHIFKILTAADFKTWWDLAAAARAADLQYVKTIGIPGDGAPWTDTNKEKFYIDVDLETGSERAIVFSRYGNVAIGGSVTRVPWKE
jgi:hypothetical protein